MTRIVACDVLVFSHDTATVLQATTAQGILAIQALGREILEGTTIMFDDDAKVEAAFDVLDAASLTTLSLG